MSRVLGGAVSNFSPVGTGLVGVEPDDADGAPVPGLARPALRMPLFGRFVPRLAVRQDGLLLTVVTRHGGQEADAAVLMVLVVLRHEGRDPGSSRLQARKGLVREGGGGLQGAEQALRVGGYHCSPRAG